MNQTGKCAALKRSVTLVSVQIFEECSSSILIWLFFLLEPLNRVCSGESHDIWWLCLSAAKLPKHEALIVAFSRGCLASPSCRQSGQLWILLKCCLNDRLSQVLIWNMFIVNPVYGSKPLNLSFISRAMMGYKNLMLFSSFRALYSYDDESNDLTLASSGGKLCINTYTTRYATSRWWWVPSLTVFTFCKSRHISQHHK